MTLAPVVSVIVATRNEAGSIRDCLDALAAQTYPRDRLEFIVADGLSDDGTREIVLEVASDDSRFTLVDNKQRITPTAWNTGLKAACGSILGIMSGHAQPAPDYVERCVEALLAEGAAAVGGRIDRRATSADQQAVALVTTSRFGVGDATHNYATAAGPVETVFPGMWPRSVLERVGLFDEELVRNQDDELSFRIRDAGLLIWYDPSIEVRYQPRSSAARLFSQYRQYGMWKVRVYQKHPRAFRPRQAVPPVWVGAMVGGLVLAPIAPMTAMAAVAAAAAYLIVMTVVALRMPARQVPAWRVVRAFAALHLGYGLGMWIGAVRFAPRWAFRRRGEEPAQLAPAGGLRC